MCCLAARMYRQVISGATEPSVVLIGCMHVGFYEGNGKCCK